MSKKPKNIPSFPNGAGQRAFPETHDSTAYLDCTKAQKKVGNR
jgi:hypothetical protein